MIDPVKFQRVVKKAGEKTAPSITDELVDYAKKILPGSSSSCLESMGRAKVAIDKVSNAVPESKEDVMKLIENILKSKGMVLDNYASEKWIMGGRAIPECKGLCHDDIRGKCIRDENGFLKKIFMINTHNREVHIYDSNGSVLKHFTPDEMSALYEYKYYPNSFHSKFRKDRIAYMTDKEKFEILVKTLDELYLNPDKYYVLEKPTVVYRALQDSLTPEQNMVLHKVGDIFTDTSYVSTTQELNTARRFKGYSPIMEITLPKGTKYFDLDELFNIDGQHWREQEFLLPRNAKFKIIGYDSANDIIRAEYIL